MSIGRVRHQPRLGLAAIAGLAIAGVVLRFALYAWAAQSYGGLGEALCHRDCGWYVRLIAGGYDVQPSGLTPPTYDDANWAFFPLYMLATRLVMLVTGLSALHSGIAVSVASTAGFLVVAARYIQATRPDANIPAWIAFGLVFPYGFYGSTVYTESLYLLLATAALLALVRRQPYRAALATALLTATRPLGVLLVPVIAIERMRFAWRAFRDRRPSGPDRLALAVDSMLPVVIAPLGLVAFMAYLHWLMGDALAFSHVQVAWGRTIDNPLAVLGAGLARWDFDQLPVVSASLSASFAVAGLLAGGFLLWRRRVVEGYLCLAAVLVPLTHGLESMPRFLAGTPVFLFALFDLLGFVRSRVATVAILAALAACQAVLLRYWFIDAHFLS